MYSINYDEKKKSGVTDGDAFDVDKTDTGYADNVNSAASVEETPFKWDGQWKLDAANYKPRGMWGENFDPVASDERWRKKFTDFMLPKDTPERRRKNYALSPAALDSALGDFYNREVKGRFEKKRDDSKRRGREEYMRYAGVVGGDPENAMYQALRVDDPYKVIDETIGELDDEQLRSLVTPLANYGGYDVDDFVNGLVKPALRDRMANEYIESEKPRSSAEYVLRSSLDNSLMGKLGQLKMANRVGTDSHIAISNEGMQRYDSNGFEGFLSGVGSLIVDAPVFGLFGTGSSAIAGQGLKLATKRMTAKVLANSTSSYMTKKYAEEIAKRAIKQSLKTKISQGVIEQGFTLGFYDVANSVADDILYGNEVDFGKAATSFLHGFASGGAAAAVATPLRIASAGLTGGKRLLSSAGVLSAESAAFTTVGTVEKAMHGIEIEPIDLLQDYANGTATLLAMKMLHFRPGAARVKLGANGKIKSEYDFTPAEKKDIRAKGVNPEEFIRLIESELKLPSFDGQNANWIKEQYATLMSGEGLAASTRAKLMFLVENKLTSTPPVAFDYKIEDGGNGLWTLTTFDMGGRVVEKKEFSNSESVRNQMLLEKGNIRKNRIVLFERELTRGLDSQNFLLQASKYAREKGVDVELLSEALYKKANGDKLESGEEKMIAEIMKRTAYDKTGMIQFLHDGRRRIEEKYNLPDGSLLTVVDKKFYDCTETQNKALDEYEQFVRGEVERLKSGTSPAVSALFVERGKNSGFSGMSNEQVQSEEMEGYRRRRDEEFSLRANTTPVQMETVPLADISKIKYSPEKVEMLRPSVERMAKLLRHDVDVITRPEDIKRPDPSDSMAVSDYNMQLGAQGWYGNNKVVINLMNIRSVEELETTVVHEVVGHAGLERLFGNYYNEFIEEVYKRADRNVRSEINKIKTTNPHYDTMRLTEEYLASLAEKAYKTNGERALFSRFKEFVRNMLVRLNIYTGKNRNFSEKELIEIMRLHCNYIVEGKDASLHRREAFGRFGSARRSEAAYNDRSLYNADLRERIMDGRHFRGTPEGFLDRKLETAFYSLPREERGVLGELIERRRNENERKRDAYRYRFIGERGVANMGMGDGSGRNTSLEMAKKLETDGVVPELIKLRTGWERGLDGDWRFEVPEGENVVKNIAFRRYFENYPYNAEMFNRYRDVPSSQWPDEFRRLWDRTKELENHRFTLKEVVGDETFFRAYPDLMNMPVRIVSGIKEPVYYDAKGKKLYVDRNLFLKKDSGVEMSAALQKIIQDYEGFSQAVPFRHVAGSKMFMNEYSEMANAVRTIEGLQKAIPGFDSNGEINGLFKKEYGFDMADFKRNFPTYDDYLIYRMTGNNMHFSGNVELDNVKNRYGMSGLQRRLSLSGSTENVPRDKQMVVRSIKDLDRFLTGPLDLIKSNLKNFLSDESLRYRSFEAPGLYRENSGVDWRRVYNDETGEVEDWRDKYRRKRDDERDDWGYDRMN